MTGPLVTLTTDFGTASPYVAAMKGVLLGVCPAARPLDLSHALPPQGVAAAADFLAACVPYFPAGTLHVVVVDPGVGTDRAILYAEAGGQRLLAPDNGVLTGVFDALGPPAVVRRLAEPRFWRPIVSATFHGRDVFAPVAGHLLNGLDPAELGPPYADWVRLDRPRPVVTPGWVRGEVAFVDDFGNLITNVPAGEVPGDVAELLVGGVPVPFRRVRTYGEAAAGEVVLLVSSDGRAEVAVVNGSAAARLDAATGTVIELRYG